MAKEMPPEHEEFRDYIRPGQRIWIMVKPDDAKASGLIKYGDDGSLTFQGYYTAAHVTFMIVDHVQGHGRKTQITKTFGINVDDIKFLAPYEAPKL
jgi:hypothetical protein